MKIKNSIKFIVNALFLALAITLVWQQSNTHNTVTEYGNATILSNHTLIHTNQNVQTTPSTNLPPMGLYNLRNTCYMSSVLQLLFRVLDDQLKLNRGRITDLFFQLKYTKATNDYKDFKNQIQNYIQITKGYDQQDAHQFLIELLNVLNDQEIKTKGNRNSIIEQTFQGKLVNELTCQKGHTKSNYQPFKCLQLTFPTNSASEISIQNMVRYISNPQTINDLECQKCSSKRQFTKITRIQTLPNILVLHLVRFQFFQTNGQKIRTVVSYDQQIQLKQKQNNRSYKYRLIGTINHSGRLGFGHYYVEVKQTDGKWYQISDEDVKEIKIQNLDNKSEYVYMLFYQRVY